MSWIKIGIKTPEKDRKYEDSKSERSRNDSSDSKYMKWDPKHLLGKSSSRKSLTSLDNAEKSAAKNVRFVDEAKQG